MLSGDIPVSRIVPLPRPSVIVAHSSPDAACAAQNMAYGFLRCQRIVKPVTYCQVGGLARTVASRRRPIRFAPGPLLQWCACV